MVALERFRARTSRQIAALIETGYLPSFPPINQLHEPASDGQPDENANDNCWAVAGVAAVNHLMSTGYNGDELHDYVYGQGYIGGGNLSDPKALAWLTMRGCHLDAGMWASDQNIEAVMAYVRRHLDLGHPVVATIPSQWGVQTRDTATGYHAVDIIGYSSTGYQIMNPWGGGEPWMAGSWLPDRIVNVAAVWRLGGATVAWKRNSDGTATDAHGHHAGTGIAARLFADGESAVDGLTSETYPPFMPGECFLALENGALYTWSAAEGVRTDRGGIVVDNLWQRIGQLEAMLALKEAVVRVPADPAVIARAAAFEQIKTALAVA